MTKILIVGGVAGGATAAARLRRLDEEAEIVIFERGSAVSFANCGLPYYIGGVIQNRDNLLLQSQAGFWSRYRIDVQLKHEVLAIDRAAKSIRVVDLETGKAAEHTYDYLILSPGARPRRPEASPAAEPFIHTLHTLDDTDAIMASITARDVKDAVVMGGGYVALETAENLVQAGIRTTLVQRSAKLLPPFDAEMLNPIYQELQNNGVELRLDTTIAEIDCAGSGIALKCSDGQSITTSMLIAAIGVEPANELAAQAGLALGSRGGISVDEQMRSSDPAIFAVGDVVEVSEFVTHTPAQIALASPANKQARVAANTICGIADAYRGTQGSAIIKVFGLTAATTGINEQTAQRLGLDYDKVYYNGMSHASYYPGAELMIMKILFEKPTGRILGAQIVGKSGTDKRADLLAIAIRAQMTARDLAGFELCYAPPYSSAKDPLNTVGLMIENLLAGRVYQYHWHDVASLPRDGSATLLDIRTPQEYAKGALAGFTNLPLDTLREHLDELDKSKPIYLCCQSGLRSYLASRILLQKGFTAAHLCGGFWFYQLAGVTQ